MTALNIDDPDWFDDAACIDVPQEVFFPRVERGQMHHAYDEAKSICARCRHRVECLEFALATEIKSRHGVWGGMTPKQRRDESERRYRRSRR